MDIKGFLENEKTFFGLCVGAILAGGGFGLFKQMDATPLKFYPDLMIFFAVAIFLIRVKFHLAERRLKPFYEAYAQRVSVVTDSTDEYLQYLYLVLFLAVCGLVFRPHWCLLAMALFLVVDGAYDFLYFRFQRMHKIDWSGGKVKAEKLFASWAAMGLVEFGCCLGGFLYLALAQGVTDSRYRLVCYSAMGVLFALEMVVDFFIVNFDFFFRHTGETVEIHPKGEKT